ncbi:MAG: hypothetical protein AB7E26_06675 [Chryseobacterium sp.]
MDIGISIYHVEKGDTLQSVAEKLGIPAEILKRYHNTYCNLKNLIGHDLTGIYEIILPSSDKIVEYKKIQKQKEIRQIFLPFCLTKDFYATKYEVSESFEQPEEENVKITYSVFVRLREDFNKGFIAEVEASDFKKNEQLPDDKISQLSLSCMKNISPIAFWIPAQGKITGFYDHKAIVKRFENSRSVLNDFFIGEVSDNYLNTFYENLKSENDLLKQFCSSLLYQALFPEMKWFQSKKDWKDYYYIVPDSFPVKCHFHRECNFENLNYIEIIIKGKIIEYCSLQELLKGVKIDEFPREQANGEIELKYTFHKESKQLTKVEAGIILLDKENLYQKHSILITAK